MYKSKDLVKWKPKQEELIARYVRAFMDILVVDENGKAKTTEGFKLKAYLKILAQNVEIYNVSALETKKHLIYRASFLRLKKYKIQDVHAFRKALASEVRQYLRQPVEKYWILFPLHVSPTQFKQFRSFSILDTKLYVRDWNYIHRNFTTEKFFQDIRYQLRGVKVSLETDFTPIMILAEGRTPGESLNKVNEAFDLFRWLLNLLSQFGRITSQWGGYPRPLGKILPPPVYGVFNSDGDYTEFFYNTAKYSEYKSNTIHVEQILDARKLAKRLRVSRSSNDINPLIVEALNKYGEALDATEWRLAYLVLWQILELITLQSAEQFSMKTVIRRINALLQQDKLAEDLLLALYETRNSLVHEGKFPDEQGLDEVNLLKYIVERSINTLFAQRKTLQTKTGLAKYYDHALANNVDLDERQRIISYIQRKRST